MLIWMGIHCIPYISVAAFFKAADSMTPYIMMRVQLTFERDHEGRIEHSVAG